MRFRKESGFSLNIGLCVSNADCLISRLSILIILILTVRSAKFLNFREDDFWRQVFILSQQAFDPCQYSYGIRAFRRKNVLVKVKVMRMSSNAFMMGRVIPPYLRPSVDNPMERIFPLFGIHKFPYVDL